ncbi:DUF3618 domain-containing protein [Agromyces protaetiae]|uniref:DUF3618 domain-containing protein n=1 Tax=Agromyces protaetiae TaxID=2509455 RepID=A0A4P6F9M3_9MICO|nr:DUF3618 domain-containing protein [Agromyces protaetiae]QAY72464.1 DUF3618 domain-containing protein [Agromyces protaetiae]
MTAGTDRPESNRDRKTRERNLTRVQARAASQQARAEFAATLNALEDKLNVPKQVGKRVDRAKATARSFYDEQPGTAIAAGVAVALAIGGIVWLVVRNATKP